VNANIKPQGTAASNKKPQTAFAIYIQEVKDQLKQEMQEKNLKQTQFLSEASKRWNTLSSIEKQKYNEMAQKQKDAYKA
jgi:HMG-box domain